MVNFEDYCMRVKIVTFADNKKYYYGHLSKDLQKMVMHYLGICSDPVAHIHQSIREKDNEEITISMINLCLRFGININFNETTFKMYEQNYKRSCLHEALFKEKLTVAITILDYLIKTKSPSEVKDTINIQEVHGATALYSAVFYASYAQYCAYWKKFVIKLIDNGAIINLCSPYYGTVLHYICGRISSGYYRSVMIKLLLDYGADPDIVDNNCKTALDILNSNLIDDHNYAVKLLSNASKNKAKKIIKEKKIEEKKHLKALKNSNTNKNTNKNTKEDVTECIKEDITENTMENIKENTKDKKTKSKKIYYKFW